MKKASWKNCQICLKLQSSLVFRTNSSNITSPGSWIHDITWSQIILPDFTLRTQWLTRSASNQRTYRQRQAWFRCDDQRENSCLYENNSKSDTEGLSQLKRCFYWLCWWKCWYTDGSSNRLPTICWKFQTVPWNQNLSKLWISIRIQHHGSPKTSGFILWGSWLLDLDLNVSF